MAQHFLLSAAAKTLTLGSVVRMSDGEVERVFIRLRWTDNGGNAYCPRCGATTVWESRRKGCLRWQCKACSKDFSLTSGTLFASRKMPLRAYLIRILRPGIELGKVVPRRVEYRPRYFNRGELARLILDYMREHPGASVAIADILPVAIGDRSLNSAEHQRVAVGIYEAMKRSERKGLISRAGEGWKAARWRLIA